ncbi:MAG: DNA polymerase IV [Acidobacteria bacterium]|nr:DNA polymerase IV [Acidobacteriota bacterium]
MERRILHLQVTTFPVSVQRVHDPSLRGRPVAILSRRSARAVITAVSQEAHGDGVRAGMCLSEARALCRRLILIPPDANLQKCARAALTRLTAAYAPLVEPVVAGGIFADLTGTSRLLGASRDTAAHIQREVFSRLNLPCSIGLSSNKLVSGVACRITPARELADVRPGDEASFLSPLPASLLPAVRQSRRRHLLTDLNLRRILDIAALPLSRLLLAFQRHGYTLFRQSRGQDDSPVRPSTRQPLIRVEETLAQESLDDDILRATLFLLVERGGRFLRRGGCRAATAHVHVRGGDGRYAARGVRLEPGTAGDRDLFLRLCPALAALTARRVRIRWMELVLTDLRAQEQQLALFHHAPGTRDRALSRALDCIRQRYGEDVVRRRGPAPGPGAA